MAQYSDSGEEEEDEGGAKERGKLPVPKENVTPKTPSEPQGATAKIRFKYRGVSTPQL